MSPPTATATPSRPGRQAPDVAALAERVRAGQRAGLARAITLAESTRFDHQMAAEELLLAVGDAPGPTVRLGISGVPGAGKSTFIDALGTMLINEGHRVAVLAVDPSSGRTGGSILGDKTRMAQLAGEPTAFIRPSPTGGNLGGVTRATRESILLCETAGFDVVIVETVGVGQSEVAVASMVDTFLVLMLARTGDHLQGIKKGILEHADVLAVNKADGDNAMACETAARELRDSLHLMRPTTPDWSTPVLPTSSFDSARVAEVWDAVLSHRATLDRTNGGVDAKRRRQQIDWMWSTVDAHLLARARAHLAEQGLGRTVEEAVRSGDLTPVLGAHRLLDALGG